MTREASKTPLYAWPARARRGRSVPKATFYRHANVNSRLRQQFVDQVERITWAFGLAEGTVGLRGTAAVPEIQVFVVAAKADDVADTVLAAMDRSVMTPVVFEVQRVAGNVRETRMTAAVKTLRGAAAPSLTAYFSTVWHRVASDDGAAPLGVGVAADAGTAAREERGFDAGRAGGAKRVPLPAAVNLEGLYAALLRPLLPLTPRTGEGPAETAARAAEVRRLERQLAGLRRKIRSEPQLNRQLELRRELRPL
ncbi:MAG: DUF4391 domain-containing protein, partial [Bifidobacteriaceae bacterium]|nr:DUF4391 domain-containing protein [Bifidobacteriaceae bacterium]